MPITQWDPNMATTTTASQIITENATRYNGTTLDRLEVTGPRGGKYVYWRRADRRESAERLVSTWDHTQSAAAAR